MPFDGRRARRPPRSAPVTAPAPRAGARTTALTLLGRRDYTAAELIDKLTTRGYDAETVAATIARLVDDRLLDDRRVATAFVRTALQTKGRGRYRIERELAARGIDRALIHELLSALAPDDEMAAIGRVLARKRLPAHPTLADRRRLFQHLLRRGFSAEAIGKAIKTRGEDLE